MTQYRRISKTLHDRCLGAAIDHKDKLTDAELRILNIVAGGWVGQMDVTKAEFEQAKMILDRIETGAGA